MRGIKNYTPKEWLLLSPPIWYFKALRNKFISRRFTATRPEELQLFLQKHAHLKGKNIAVVVAFNSPWIIRNLLPAMKRFLRDAEVIVFDNSNKTELREEIETTCKAENISYFSLPSNPEKHPCRSHGISLNWIYNNVLKPLEPNIFACIDHDLIPFREVRLADLLGNQMVYGLQKTSPWFWFLWAGYCMFSFSELKNKKVDFNNDRPSLLDTGGQNSHSIYRYLDTSTMRFACTTTCTLRHPDGIQTMDAEILDNAWFHLGGVGQTCGRKDYFSDRAKFYADLFNEVQQGKNLIDFIDIEVQQQQGKSIP
ncbi:hypothetical protein P4E94_07305 [Pontiellaceae bacterium B12219]|nr:hypothetical protein [Pontiellaceae bacterium B12219]